MRPNRRFVMRQMFNLKLWQRLLDRLNGPHPHDPQANHLREGIAHFRMLCAQREKRAL